MATNFADAFTQRELTPPKPGKHPLRNFDVTKIAEVMADPRFQVDTQGMSPQQYGMHLADLTGQSVMDFQNAMSDPNSNLRQAQQVDLASSLGSEGASMRMITLPGVSGIFEEGGQEVIFDPKENQVGYFVGSYRRSENKGEKRDIIDDLVSAMGREDLKKDFLVWSSLANDATIRHELAHRGITRLLDKGFRITESDEELIMRMFSYLLGDDDAREQSYISFKQDYDMSPKEIFQHKGIRDLLNKVQKEIFKELGGVEIPKPYFIK